MRSFKKYLVPVVSVGAIALGMSEMASATMATGPLPADVQTALSAVGFAGVIPWVIGAVTLVGSIAGAFAVARVLKRGASHI